MRYRHTFRLEAPASRVAEFHHSPGGLGLLTPPPVLVQLRAAPDRIEAGSEVSFTLWFGPLPVSWSARFERAGEDGFTDRQIRGPFRAWYHQRSFIPLDRRSTEIREEIEGRLRLHLLWGPFGALMWLTLPLLFAFRSWKMRRLLEKGDA
jgi:ligand-binding SRPBCC domain-containing protein